MTMPEQQKQQAENEERPTLYDWQQHFGGYREFHMAMTKHMMFGDIPILPDYVKDPAQAWQECLNRFFVASTANLLIRGICFKMGEFI